DSEDIIIQVIEVIDFALEVVFAETEEVGISEKVLEEFATILVPIENVTFVGGIIM
ncbi:hypothetical protein U1Q18_012438, partial [Sarracenia purpurea var. burkii]